MEPGKDPKRLTEGLLDTESSSDGPSYIGIGDLPDAAVGDDISPDADNNDTCCSNFFEWGVDFESSTTAHKFKDIEKVKMSKFEALNQFPQNSKLYRSWVAQQDEKGVNNRTWDRWLGMALIG